MSDSSGSPEVIVDLDVDPAGVGTLTFTRGQYNYLSADLVARIAGGINDLESRGARVVVLAGTGKHFCAGADFASGDAAPPGAATSPIYEMVPRLFDRTVPVIAAVQGAAVGGGMGLALAADFRVASGKTRFTANFSKLGFSQGFALSVTLPRLVGLQRASELLYTGRNVRGDEALDIGLCDRLAADGHVLADARAFAGEIAAAAPLAVQAIRRRLHGDLVTEVEDALRRDWQDQTTLKLTADFREGVAAAKERREPRFVAE